MGVTKHFPAGTILQIFPFELASQNQQMKGFDSPISASAFWKLTNWNVFQGLPNCHMNPAEIG